MRNLIAALCCAILLVVVPAAAKDYDYTQNGTSFGLTIGGTGLDTFGVGISKYFDNDIGIKSSIGGFAYNDRGYVGASFVLTYTLAHFYFDFKSLKQSSFRLVAGGVLKGVYRYNEGGPYYDSEKYPNQSIVKHIFHPAIGPILGGEYFFFKHISAFAGVPFLVSFQVKDKKFSFKDALFSFSAGLNFYF